MENVHCSSKQLMVIKSANYGDFSKNGAFNNDKKFDKTCSAVVSSQIKSRCDGKGS